MLTNQSPPHDVAAAIIAETKRRGYSRDESIAVVSTGIQESGLRMVWDSGRRWFGYFQQDGSYPNRFDPMGNILGFLDRLEPKRHPKPGSSPDPFANIFWLQQGPNWPSAEHGLRVGRRAYYDEIKRHIVAATAFYDQFSGEAVPQDPNRPPFNEFPIWSANSSTRSQKPTMFLLHTQEGGGGDAAAENLAKWFQSGNGVSYHYTISQAADGGVTVVDCVDTDRAAWSVGNANGLSINLCFAGSRASWNREQWLKQAKAIDIAAFLAVQDAKKYGFPTLVVPPPYTNGKPGISDHRWVTDVFKWGSHTDVGAGFPWDVFAAAVQKYATGAPKPPVPPAPVKRIPQDLTDREVAVDVWDQLRGPGGKGWEQLGGKTIVDSLADLHRKLDNLQSERLAQMGDADSLAAVKKRAEEGDSAAKAIYVYCTGNAD